MLKDLSRRSKEPELMDDFKGSLVLLRTVFDDINRVNKILGGNHITVKAVAKLISENPKEEYTIIDMGCGDGNMLREVAEYCQKQGVRVNLIGIDLNKGALQLAKEISAQYDEIQYVHQDILKLDPSTLNCDILINTLTMHHFSDENMMIFLQKFIDLARIGIVINDLHRSTWAYYLFKLFSAIFIKTNTAKIDGLISISKAFIKSDLITYSKSFPTVNHYIKWKWAFRYVWIMQPNQESTI